jgi:Protein of unknown function (DUF1579)
MTRVLLILSLISGGTVASAQQPTPEQKKAMQQAMLEKMQPAAEHKTLAALDGKWSTDVLYRMGDGPTLKARGVATNRMILGGRFLESRATSNNPAGPGLGDANVESLTIYGFDRRTGDYTSVGFDTMGTYWVSAAGKMSEGQSIVMSGETLDDHAGSKEIRKYDMVLRVVDPDTYVTEIIFKFANRPDLKLVEVTHRRMK